MLLVAVTVFQRLLTQSKTVGIMTEFLGNNMPTSLTQIECLYYCQHRTPSASAVGVVWLS